MSEAATMFFIVPDAGESGSASVTMFFNLTGEKRVELGRHGWKEQGAAPSWIIVSGIPPSKESSGNVCIPVKLIVKA